MRRWVWIETTGPGVRLVAGYVEGLTLISGVQLSRENLALIRQLQASDLINSKLSVQVQRLQYENMMVSV